MRGVDQGQAAMFSYISPEKRVPSNHPLRPIREMVDAALQALSPRFDALYAGSGRPSIPPERLLRALLLQILYTIRSERMLMEQLDYNLLFRWFVGLAIDDPVWDHSVFTKNRDRLLEGDIARAFFDEILEQARKKALLSNEHFTVDGTLIKAWASHKSMKPKDGPPAKSDGDPGNPTVDFRGERRTNATHESTTDPDARLARRKGTESLVALQGHVLMENRNGLVVDTEVTLATGTAEREAALEMLGRLGGKRRRTVGGDRGYDVREFVERLREAGITPHIAAKESGSALDERTTRHTGYRTSLRIRKRIEEVFGWMKTVGPMRQTKLRGTSRVGWAFTFTAAAYNLVRIRTVWCAQ